MRGFSGIRVSIVDRQAPAPAAILVAALILLMTALTLAGCGGGDENPDEPAAMPEQSVGVTGEGSNTGNPSQKAGQPQNQGSGNQQGGNPNGNQGGNPDNEPGTGSISPEQMEGQFIGIGSGLPGQVGMLIAGAGGPGPQAMVGEPVRGPALSIINLPLSGLVLRGTDGPGAARPETRNQIEAAVSRSDEAAAKALMSQLEQTNGGTAGAMAALGEAVQSEGVSGVASAGGNGSGTPGADQMLWPLDSQVRYMAALAGGCLATGASRRFLLASMGPAEGRETFGIGSAGTSARWISGSGEGLNGRTIVRQLGTIESGGQTVVVAMVAAPEDGEVDTGKEMLDELVDRLSDRLGSQGIRKQPCASGGQP